VRTLFALSAGAAVLTIAAAATPSVAQAPSDAPPHFEGSALFSYLGSQGNSDTQSLGAGVDAAWRPQPWTYRAKGNFAQNKTGSVSSAESITALARASREIGKLWSLFGQYDFLRDRFAGVDQRQVGEGGLTWRPLDTDLHKLRFDFGAGYLHEQGPTKEFDSSTGSLGAAYRYAISKNSDFTYEPRYRVPFANTDDWKFDHDASLSVAMNSILSMKLTHTLHYSNQPAPGFKATDTVLSVSLVARMSRV
jgi:putative salt-induced outer membrane protein YdiY